MSDLVESVEAKLCHCFVHNLDQVQQLSMSRTHLHTQEGPAYGGKYRYTHRLSKHEEVMPKKVQPKHLDT